MRGSAAYQRVLFAGAFDEIPDKQGRVTIPPALREYAGLDREVVVCGHNATVEIWDAATWESYLASQEDAFSGLGEEVDRRNPVTTVGAPSAR